MILLPRMFTKTQLSSTTFLDNTETHSLNEEKKTATDTTSEKESPQVQVEEDKQQQQNQPSLVEEEPQIQQDPDSKKNILTKVSSEICQEDSLVFSSDRSSVTDDDSSSKVEEEKLLGTGEECTFNEKNHETLETFSLPSLYHNLLSKKGSNKVDHHQNNKTDTPDSSFSTASSSSSSSQSSQPSFTRIRSNSTRVSNVFRNWISCGTVETNDAALVLMNQAHKMVSKEEPNNHMPEKRAEIFKGDKLGGSARCFGTSWNYHHHQDEQYGAR